MSSRLALCWIAVFAVVVNSFQLKYPSGPRKQLSLIINANGSYSIDDSLNPNADIEAFFVDGMDTTGWGILEIRTNVIKREYQVSDNQLMFYAGFVEGYLTSLRIYQTWLNMRTEFGYENGPPPKLAAFLNQQSQYEDEMIKNNPGDAYWQYADLLRSQLAGLWAGYNTTAIQNQAEPFNTSWPVTYLNLVGDLLDLKLALFPEFSALHDFTKLDYATYKHRQFSYGSHCSALIKVSPTFDNLYLGHSAWFTYKNTNRIFKNYVFKLTMVTASTHMMFSSYPGYLESLDDFYIMDSGLVMLQTTNIVPNHTVYDAVTPSSLFAWQRVRIANALATSGKEWWQMVARDNSGTYNNQYMIVNYGLFTPGQPLPDDFLWVIEQMPGLVAAEDMTQVLVRGYWGSYNVPALKQVYVRSGYPQLVEKFGVQESYDLAPRARIFRRGANKVSNLNDAYSFLRYNNYTTDELEHHDPTWAICSRGDLVNGTTATPGGCYDTKVSDFNMILDRQALIINAPTYVDNPPFDWRDFPAYQNLHQGIKNVMDYQPMWYQSEF